MTEAGWRPRLVALDIDGTLHDEEQRVSPPVADAVCRVRDAGCPIVLSTGRGLIATHAVAESFELEKPYLVCSNGAVTVRLRPEIEFIDVVTFDIADLVRGLLERMPEALIAVEQVGIGYRVNRPFPPGDLSGAITVQPVADLIAEPATRVIVREPGSDADAFLDLVDRIGFHDVSYYVGYTAWLDLAPLGVSKAYGLDHVTRRLGVDPADVLAIGDGRNDVEMLEWAGRGVAMGGAPDEVVAAADAVTGSVAEDGVATELARYF